MRLAALEYGPVVVCLLFLGRLDKIQLDGYALGTLYSNVTALSLGYGLSTAVDTLCSQVTGADDRGMIGIYMQRGILISLIALVPAAAFTWFAEPILLAVGQDPTITHHAARFCIWLLPSCGPMWLWEIVSKALQAQSVVKPAVYVSICMHPCCFLACLC